MAVARGEKSALRDTQGRRSKGYAATLAGRMVLCEGSHNAHPLFVRRITG